MSEITTKTQRVGDIFKAKNNVKYEVPVYQRGYSWEDKQIEEFCDDLWELDVQPGTKQPFGIMFVQKQTEGGFEKIKIIDGQQRTTTVSTFICVVRDYIDEISAGDKLADELHALLYIFDDQLLKINENSPVLTLGRLNREYFSKAILSRKIYGTKTSILNRTDNDSCVNMKDAYVKIRVYIEKKLRKLPDVDDTPENPNPPISVNDRIVKLNHVWNTLMQNFSLIVVTVPDEKEAYKMFHTINNRGLKLAEADLIKHHLFSQMHDELKKDRTVNVKDKLDNYDELWTSLRDNITAEGDGDYEISVFIHHYLVAYKNKESNVKKIYEEIVKWSEEKSSSPTVNKAIEIIDQLVVWGGEFWNIRNPDTGFPGEKGIIYYLKKIRQFGNWESVYPIIIAGYHKFWLKQDKDSFRKLVEIIFKYHLRNKTIGKVSSTPYADKLRGLSNDIVNKNLDVSSILKELTTDSKIHVSVDRIRLEMKERSFSSKMSSVILQEIERVYDPDKKPGDDVTVEHVMPMSKKQWADYIKKENNLSTDTEVTEFHRDYKNYLGNQVLLPGKKNTKVSNKPFADKKTEYAATTYQITKRIANSQKWTKKEIEDNQALYTEKVIEALDYK